MSEAARHENVLTGTRVLITRGALQAEELSAEITNFGGTVREFPVIGIAPPKSFAELDEAIDHIEQYNWIVFASANAVDYFLARYRERGADERRLGACRLAVIGPATGNALARQGYRADFTPRSFVADALVEEFARAFDLAGKRILWPRTTVGRQLIKEQLTAAGARIDMVTAYETVLPEESIKKAPALLDLLENREIDIILMASSQSVRNFADIIKFAIHKRQSQDQNEDTGCRLSSSVAETDSRILSTVLQTVKILTIGPETSKTVIKELACQPLEAKTFTIQGMIERLIEYVQAGGNKSLSAESETLADKLGKNL